MIDLFRCDKAYYQAVEVTTGNRLFYHVVDDDRIAMKIMKEVCFQMTRPYIKISKLVDETS